MSDPGAPIARSVSKMIRCTRTPSFNSCCAGFNTSCGTARNPVDRRGGSRLGLGTPRGRTTMSATGTIRLKRGYVPASPDDGVRVLVDRLWPRGLARESAAIDEWLKEVAPSPELRRWWDHDPDRMSGFADRYTAEL